MMNLHSSKDAFKVLLDDIHTRTGYRLDVLEKDYYVVLMLEELADKQSSGLQAYFKGGTALYKALKTTNRFSEDIDLSVDTRDCSRSQNDKRLEQASKKYSALPRSPEEGRTNRSEVISVYHYDPVVPYDSDDALQRFGKLKIEANSFTISEPVTELEISAMIYDLANEQQKRILEDMYDVKPFKIKTITIERIFIDKLFAAEAYVRKSSDPHRAFEAAKHIYDLAVMSQHPSITALYGNNELMKKLIDIRMEEEQDRLDGIPGVEPHEFTFFKKSETNNAVISAYKTMQNQYVLRKSDRIEFEQAVECLHYISERLNSNPVWNKNLSQPERQSVLKRLEEAQKEQIKVNKPKTPRKDHGAR